MITLFQMFVEPKRLGYGIGGVMNRHWCQVNVQVRRNGQIQLSFLLNESISLLNIAKISQAKLNRQIGLVSHHFLTMRNKENTPSDKPNIYAKITKTRTAGGVWERTRNTAMSCSVREIHLPERT
jgi:hypothetical protein